MSFMTSVTKRRYFVFILKENSVLEIDAVTDYYASLLPTTK
jgi:hypothetical protein